MFDPETYTMTIRKELVDGEELFVGRVAEFPNISAYEGSYEDAREMLIDSLITLKRIADEEHVDFPCPNPVMLDEFTGRMTLRLPKSLHAKVTQLAVQENVSVNQYLVYAISSHVGEVTGSTKMLSTATNTLMSLVNNAISSVKIGFIAKTSFDESVYKRQSTSTESTLPAFIMPSSQLEELSLKTEQG